MTEHATHPTRYADIKRRYDRDGFAILRGFATADEVAELRAQAEPTVERLMARAQPPRTEHTNIFKNLQAENPWFEEQLTAGRHVPLMRTLIGDELEPATAAWFDRPSGSATGVRPHIDGGGRGGGQGVGATIWIALDQADSENGCLYYGRRSHLAKHSDRIFLPKFDIESDGVAVEVAPGDAAVHSALTVHWSGPNPSVRPRRAVSYFYWGTTHAAAMRATTVGQGAGRHMGRPYERTPRVANQGVPFRSGEP